MRTMKNNKGVALVTVLIGVSFIIILASSLVYMSYMNYITKALRNATTDNFYTDEFALDDLCMSLQQVVTGVSSVDTAKNMLRSATGAGTNPSGPGMVYNNETVAALIQVASQEAEVTVDTSVDTSLSGNYIEGSSFVKLVGVEVTTTTEQGYQSTICTDITINFPNGGLGDLDVNDFSVITDSPIVANTGDVFFSGCVFISNPGGDALTVNQANVQILATRGIINGNLKIENNSYVAITGNVSITGNIVVGNNSVLVCSDRLHYKGSISGGGRVVGSPTHEPDMNTDAVDALTNGLSRELFSEVYFRSSEGSTFTSITLEDYLNNGIISPGVYVNRSTAPSGLQVGMSLGAQNVINGNDFYNSIIMTTKDVTVRGELENSTVICSGAITFDILTASTYMQCMTDEVYETAKTILIPRYPNHNGVNNAQGTSGFWSDDMVDTADDTFSVTVDGEERTFVYRGGTMYVPCGYFLRPDTSSVITNIFSGMQGNADPGNSTLIIENWIKE